MGLQRSKLFFLLRSQNDEFHYNFGVQSYAIFATGSATSSKLPLVTAWTVRVPVPPKPSTAPSVLGSDRASLRFQQRGFLPTVDSHVKSVFHRRFTLHVELTILQVEPVGGGPSSGSLKKTRRKRRIWHPQETVFLMRTNFVGFCPKHLGNFLDIFIFIF